MFWCDRVTTSVIKLFASPFKTSDLVNVKALVHLLLMMHNSSSGAAIPEPRGSELLREATGEKLRYSQRRRSPGHEYVFDTLAVASYKKFKLFHPSTTPSV